MSSNDFSVRPLTESDRGWLVEFMLRHWGADAVVVHDHVFTPSTHPGFVAEHDAAPVGVLTYAPSDAGWEIVTLDSTAENRGIGSALIQAVDALARGRGASRLWLVTTNDNLHALGFYQRRGFRIVGVDRGAVERARALKPSIPPVADNGIPILDELRLEKTRGAIR